MAFLRVHQTPLFLVDKKIFLARIVQMQDAMRRVWKSKIVAYSFKTNDAIAQSGLIRSKGLWAEVVSGKEYTLARKMGFGGNTVIFNGPWKTDAELTRAFDDGALVHIDNESELVRILALVAHRKKNVSVGLRVHSTIRGMVESRFGFSIEDGMALRAAGRLVASGSVHLVSVHAHIGSDVDGVSAYQYSARAVGKFIARLEHETNIHIRYVDFGGGFPSSGLPPFGKKDWHPQPITTYIAAISKELSRALPIRDTRTIIVEPGRYLVDDATVFVTHVVHQRPTPKGQRVIVDATITMLPLLYYRPPIVRAFTEDMHQKTDHMSETIVYGASCREDDVLFRGLFPTLRVGDFVVYYCVGAYNQSMGSDFIFGRPGMNIL